MCGHEENSHYISGKFIPQNERLATPLCSTVRKSLKWSNSNQSEPIM